MIKYNLVFQMDREDPLTKHNWMCELSSSPKTKQLPSLHYKEELISILTSPLLIHSHIFSCYCYTNTLKSFSIFENSAVGEETHSDYLTIQLRKTAQHICVIVHSLGEGWKVISAKQQLHELRKLALHINWREIISILHMPRHQPLSTSVHQWSTLI